MNYFPALRNLWHSLGINVQQYIVDVKAHLKDAALPGMVLGVNSYHSIDEYRKIQSKFPDHLVMGSEVYSGWIVHWNETFETSTPTRCCSPVFNRP